MHVLVLAPGHVIHSRRLILALLRSGHRVSLLSTESPIEDSRNDYRFIRLVGVRGFHRLNARLASRLELPTWAFQMWRVWRDVRPDLVNVQGIDRRAVWAAAAGIGPLVLTSWGADINDLFDSDFNDKGYLARMESLVGASFSFRKDRQKTVEDYKRRIGKALRKADLVTAVTPQILRRCEHLAAEALPTSLFRFGVDFAQFKPGYEDEARAMRRQLGIPDDAKVLLSVRTLQPLFGHQHILEAFADVTRDVLLPKTVLVFQSKYTFAREQEALKSRINQLGLNNVVFWLPAELAPEQLPVQYALADIVINYPVHDGFPVSLLEAAACKTVVITSNIEAYDGTYGDSFLSAPSQDPKALSREMRRALTEGEAERNTRVERAYAIAREIGDQDTNFAELFRHFETLVPSRSEES